MSIESVTMFKCPETGKLYKTKRGAENSAKRVRDERSRELLATGFDPSEFESQRDYVRLNATSPKHIIELVIEKAEEFWGLKVTSFLTNGERVYYNNRENCTMISFGSCEVEVDAAGSCRLEYMRRQAKRDKNRWFSEPSISNLLFDGSGFKGFETGSGGPGRCSDAESSGYPFRMGLQARLEEFPIIHKRYGEWELFEAEYDRYVSSRDRAKDYGLKLARSTPEYDKLRELQGYHEACGAIIRDSIRELENHYVSGLVEKWEGLNPAVVLDPELSEMFGR
jgi:hypothetical protein